MDARLLIDPAFWTAAEPCVPGGLSGPLPRVAALEGHVLFQTSGSTGRPKWIALSKEALLISAAAVNRHLRVDDESRWGLALPWHHVGGFGVVARAFEAACVMKRFTERWDPALFAAWVAREEITHTSLVPTQVHDLVSAGAPGPGSITAIVVGGGRLDPVTGNAARALGWPVLASYGMTEAGSQIATQGLEILDKQYEEAPLPLLDIWNAGTGDHGLLRISGPALFSGTLVPGERGLEYLARAGPWHETSDRAAVSGRLITPLGRADARVKVLGELVDPEAIERELLELGKGRLIPGAFAVAAVPDERAGSRLVPLFEAACDAKVVDSVLAAYAASCPGFRRLAAAVFVTELPRSPLGKLARAAINDFFKA